MARPRRQPRITSYNVCYTKLLRCDVVSWRPEYLGPAALNRAWTLVNDQRDVQLAPRLAAVAGDAGCHTCHTQGSSYNFV